MENPDGKRRFPWGWVAVGCGVITIIVIALLVVAFFAALPAIRSTLANLNLNFSQTPAPLGGATLVPNSGSGNGSTIGNLPFKFSAVQNPAMLGTQSLMDQMTTTLGLNSDTDFMAPKSYKGSASLDPTTPFTIGNGWCAVDSATLQQNLANMQFLLSIDGVNIDLSQYPTLYFSDNQGHACAMTGISITSNSSLRGSYHVVLTQKYLKSLSDGITSSPYPAGDVTFDFSFIFEATPSNGTQTYLGSQ
jgi:hypothetical protein